MTARVQSDVVADLPAGVGVDRSPVCSGARRALASMRPVADGSVSLIHAVDVDLPLRARVPTVTTVHDLSVFDVPWAHSRARARAERLLTSRAVAAADAIVAVSDFTADSIARRFGRSATVTRLAPSPDMVPAPEEARRQTATRYDLPDRFVLHVGTIEPRKDVPRLIEACGRLAVPLVLAGAGHPPSDHGQADVRPLGYVDRSDLPALYGSASVVAYPSIYEGFGLPPVEAMACGAAVVATAVGALPELGGDRFPLCRPGDTESLTAAIERALVDDGHRQHLVDAGRIIAESLSWTDTAAATIDVYRSLGVDV